MCRSRMRPPLAPTAVAASTNSRSRRALTSLYTTRAIGTQFRNAITSATIHRLGRRIAVSAMASSSTGKASITSVKRMMSVPAHPRVRAPSAPNSPTAHRELRRAKAHRG